MTLRRMGREVQCIPCRGGCAGATQGVLRYLRALSLGTGVAWPMAARVPALTQTEDFFLIVAGLYTVTALRENDNERATVYTKQRLTPHYNHE